MSPQEAAARVENCPAVEAEEVEQTMMAPVKRLCPTDTDYLKIRVICESAITVLKISYITPQAEFLVGDISQ